MRAQETRFSLTGMKAHFSKKTGGERDCLHRCLVCRASVLSFVHLVTAYAAFVSLRSCYSAETPVADTRYQNSILLGCESKHLEDIPEFALKAGFYLFTVTIILGILKSKCSVITVLLNQSLVSL